MSNQYIPSVPQFHLKLSYISLALNIILQKTILVSKNQKKNKNDT